MLPREDGFLPPEIRAEIRPRRARGTAPRGPARVRERSEAAAAAAAWPRPDDGRRRAAALSREAAAPRRAAPREPRQARTGISRPLCRLRQAARPDDDPDLLHPDPAAAAIRRSTGEPGR